MNWVRSSGSLAITDPLIAPWVPEESPWRWWVFLLFCALSASNAIVAMTFSSLPSESQRYYSALTPAHINLLLMWSAVLPLVGMIPTIWLLTKADGVVLCMKLGASFTLLGCIVRYIPSLWSEETRHLYSGFAVVLLHCGQILNGCAYPLFMASPSQLSATWFPADRRTTVTAISVVFCEIGSAIAFFIPSFSSNIPFILLMELLMAFVIGVCTLCLIFIPGHPRRRGSTAGLKEPPTALETLKLEVGQAVQNKQFMTVAVTMGICGGVWTGWCPAIASVLSGTFTENQGDQLSLVANMATIMGGIVIGPITDRFFPKHFKWPMVIMMAMCVVSFSWFTIALPTPSHFVNKAPNLKDVRKESFTILNIPVILTGLLEGATVPLAYELCSQLLYPLSEGTSGGLYQLFVNFGQLSFLLVPMLFKKRWYNFWCLVSVVIGLCGVLSVKHVYRAKTIEPCKGYGTLD